jgi:hypothetical protein
MNIKNLLPTFFQVNPLGVSKLEVTVFVFENAEAFQANRGGKKLTSFTNVASLKAYTPPPSKGLVVYKTNRRGEYAENKEQAVLYLSGEPFNAVERS